MEQGSIVVQLRQGKGLMGALEPPVLAVVCGVKHISSEALMDPLKATLIFAAILVPVFASAQDLAPMSLSSLSATPAKISTATVENLHGQVIGRVASVAADQSGKPAAISVTTPEGTKVVAAQAASYDESRNLVVTDLPAPQVASAAR
jgi:hypothetical protein